ncbi:selenocysteine-specific translation elongation factor [Desulfitobacterium chlororespirans]|uniref:Selenocysteine-specific elongation factor n=1 Tax=Desulfitobacterium chlororespirans DSM 11544 TaxID=1121395 RepID=A0A1M7USY1_9FIRM|nr:selenocysteine-specific translation elongation factor [Desulfitobacterium chlororespirans]SHN86111.1 selenocysteine-specific translation elongation factor SelB [Desulfitobacterium chlororespirans DSM 11544]
MKKIVLGTAGHIDHGKTSLVRKLTGIDTDRLEEEKRRGMTIELGFASLTLPSGQTVSIIDVPGHEKFVKTMVAGVTGIDLVMLVIAADEGIMPQTREHLDILNLLNVTTGVIALTKTDLVDDEWLEMIIEDIQNTLQGTTLAESPMVHVSSVTGEGISQLRETLDQLARKVQTKESQELFRLPIDRVFSMSGHGTVITGTITSGVVRKGDTLAIYPSGLNARVKGIQVHNMSVDEGTAGDRCALNLTGIEKSEIQRGDTIAREGTLIPIRIADVLIYIVKGKGNLVHNQRVHVHTGTKEVLARVRLLGTDEIPEGEKGYAQLRFEEPIVILRKDRFIIRSYSPAVTIGGGWVLYHTTKNRQRFSQESMNAMSIGEHGTREELVTLILNSSEKPLSSGDLLQALNTERAELQETLDKEVSSGKLIILKETRKYLSINQYEKYFNKIQSAFRKMYQKYPYRYQMDKEELKSGAFSGMDPKDFAALLNYFIANQRLLSDGNYLSEPDGKALARILAAKETALMEKAFLAYDMNTGSIQQAAKDTTMKTGDVEEVVKFLLKSGNLVDLGQGILVHKEALQKVCQTIRSLMDVQGTISVAEVRDALNIGRKTVVAYLEYLDKLKITLRKEDVRVPGAHY